MYAISVRQPYAALLLSGEKKYEARTWQPAELGWFLLHASSNYGLRKNTLAENSTMRIAVKKTNDDLDPRQWTRSAIIGAIEVVGILDVQESKVSKRHRDLCGDPIDGVLWKIGRTFTLSTSIACHGQLGIFSPPSLAVQKAVAELATKYDVR